MDMQLLHHDLGEAVGDAALCGGGDGVVAMVDFHRHHGSRGGVPNHEQFSGIWRVLRWAVGLFLLLLKAWY